MLQAVEYFDLREEPGDLDITIIAQAGDSFQTGPFSAFDITIQPINDQAPVLDLSASENTTANILGSIFYYEESGVQFFTTDPSIFDADLNTEFEVNYSISGGARNLPARGQKTIPGPPYCLG